MYCVYELEDINGLTGLIVFLLLRLEPLAWRIVSWIIAKSIDVLYINYVYCNTFSAANETLERLDLSWNHIRKQGALEFAMGVKVGLMIITDRPKAVS